MENNPIKTDYVDKPGQKQGKQKVQVGIEHAMNGNYLIVNPSLAKTCHGKTKSKKTTTPKEETCSI